MRKQALYLRSVCSLALLLFSLSAMSLAQEAKANKQIDAHALIKKLEDRNERVVVSAASELISAGESVIPLLIDSLEQRKGCRFYND